MSRPLYLLQLRDNFSRAARPARFELQPIAEICLALPPSLPSHDMTEQRRRLRLSLRVAFHPSLASQNPTLYVMQGVPSTYQSSDLLISLSLARYSQ